MENGLNPFGNDFTAGIGLAGERGRNGKSLQNLVQPVAPAQAAPILSVRAFFAIVLLAMAEKCPIYKLVFGHRDSADITLVELETMNQKWPVFNDRDDRRSASAGATVSRLLWHWSCAADQNKFFEQQIQSFAAGIMRLPPVHLLRPSALFMVKSGCWPSVRTRIVFLAATGKIKACRNELNYESPPNTRR
jgi:hypothetical protein